MIYLIKQGLPPNPAFKIMETVRKGKALKDPEKWKEYTELMKEHNVPEWYIKSCEKIKYMFPKAHAAAYVTNAFRIAWFKVHEPKAYYTAFFSIRASDEFDSEIMIFGEEKVKNKMKEIDLQGNNATPKDKTMYPVLELVLEMYERGIKFLPIDLYKSSATKFLVEEDGIRPPLNSIAGLGTVAALGIVCHTVIDHAFSNDSALFLTVKSRGIILVVHDQLIRIVRLKYFLCLSFIELL